MILNPIKPIHPTDHRRRNLIGTLILLVLPLLAAGGCQPHMLQGRVISGPISSVYVVPKSDTRLQQGQPVSMAHVQFTLDPNSLGLKRLGTHATEQNGEFAVPIDEFGAGLLEYELGVVARRRGFNSANMVVPFPSSDKRLLIILASGRDQYQSPEDPFADVDHFMPKSRIRQWKPESNTGPQPK